MGNHQPFNPETGFGQNQDRTEDFIITNRHLSSPSLNESVLSNQIFQQIEREIIWNPEPIFNNNNINPPPPPPPPRQRY
jgi:hypothetical protein